MTLSETIRIERSSDLDGPAVVSGSRAYLVGLQDGSFPDMGWHTSGEMGGLWAHPIKLFDGFWISVDGTWLGPARSFVSEPFQNVLSYEMPDGLSVTETRFVPDGLPAVLVSYEIRAAESRTLALCLVARSDLQGVWPRPASDGTSDEARFISDEGVWLITRPIEPWSAAVGSTSHRPTGHHAGIGLWGAARTAGDGIGVDLEYEVSVQAGTPVIFEVVLCGSHEDARSTLECFDRCRQGDRLRASKAARYHGLRETCRLDVPDSTLRGAWDWLKFDLDWMVRDVPGVGRAIGGGLADYPWWFGCDGAYSVLGALVLGVPDEAIATLDLLHTLSVAANGPSGRVLHECNTWGQTTHPGNVQETSQFAVAVWQTYRWTGDRAFLERHVDFCRRGVLDWVLGTNCRDGDILPYGYGVTEVEGLDLRCIDSATHTSSALKALAGMAAVLGDGAEAERCSLLAARLDERIDEAFWIEEEGVYGDMVATSEEMVPRLRLWIERARTRGEHFTPRSVEGLERLLRDAASDPEPQRERAWLLRNWIVISPLEEGIAEQKRAARVLQWAESPQMSGPYGMYLNGLARSEMMSINTGVLAACEFAYGRRDQGLAYLHTLASTLDLHMPGAISEMSPDGGCCVQAWSSFALAWPVVRFLFGLDPDAGERVLTVRPHFPSDWSAARLDRLPVGSTHVDLIWDGRELEVRIDEPGWRVAAPDGQVRVPEPAILADPME